MVCLTRLLIHILPKIFNCQLSIINCFDAHGRVLDGEDGTLGLVGIEVAFVGKLVEVHVLECVPRGAEHVLTLAVRFERDPAIFIVGGSNRLHAPGCRGGAHKRFIYSHTIERREALDGIELVEERGIVVRFGRSEPAARGVKVKCLSNRENYRLLTSSNSL